MRRPTSVARQIASALVVSGLVLLTATCTMNAMEPIDPPAETWDPGLNTHTRGSDFQNLLERYAGRGLPGVVLLVRTPEGLWNGAAGYARIENREPMTPTHLHHAASVTKMYMATAVLLLAQDDLIDLDAPIREYLPSEVWGSVPNGSDATVRQLLGHRSGIPDFSGDLRYDMDFLNDPLGTYSTEKLLSYLEGQATWIEPGGGFFYSNANYFLLALIADAVAGGASDGTLGHADVISDRILRPLGLTGTCYKNEAGFPTPAGLVNSYEDLVGDGRVMNVTDLTTHSSTIFSGNAGLMATSADFAAFLDALLDGRVLDPALLDQMQERTGEGWYGLGLSFVRTDYGLAVGHGGGDMGVRSEVRRFSEHDATVVLLSNGGDGGLQGRLFDELWDEVLELALGG